MGNTFLYRMPAGIAGAISRPQDLTVEPQLLDSSNLFPAYGLGGKISSGKFVPIAASDTASVLVGIYVRPYPTASQPDKVQQVGSGKNFTGDCLGTWLRHGKHRRGCIQRCSAWPGLYASGYAVRFKPSRRVPCRR